MTAPIRRRPPWFTVSAVVIVASLFVVAIGVQAWIAQRDDAARDRAYKAQQAEQDAADRDYADCLTTFAADLVETLEAVRGVNGRLEDAEERLEAADARKERALDQLVTTIVLLRRIPPEATSRDFDQALAQRFAAQERYDDVAIDVERVRARVERVRARNPYVSPEVVCTR